MSKINLIQGDCLEVLKTLPDGSIDLIITDPPYNIGKAEWDKIDNYVDWCGEWILESQRVLKSTGSFYFFHNDLLQIAQLIEWIRCNSHFVFKQFIVWNKRFEGSKKKPFFDGFCAVEGLRNYQKMAEYCLFYTFQDETGLSQVMKDVKNFPTLRRYSQKTQEWLGLTLPKINKRLGHRKLEHFFYWRSSQWGLPKEERYQELIDVFSINRWEGFRPYESLREEYESLREEYESLRYTFNSQKTCHSVWNYDTAPKYDHITPKPVNLIENILKHSSNEGDTVLDLFMGSGTTGVACKNLNRDFIGIEISPEYFESAKKRINNEDRMFLESFSIEV